MVTITRIDLVGAGGATTLSNAKVTTNLLTLSNEVSALVQDAVVAPGTYSKLRFVISGGYVEYLMPGAYTVSFALDPSVTGAISIVTTPPIPAPVAVTSGAATQADFTLTSAKAP